MIGRLTTLCLVLVIGTGVALAQEPACSLYKVNTSLLNVSKDAGSDIYVDVLEDGEIACVTRQQKVGADDWGYVSQKVAKPDKRTPVDGWSTLRYLVALSPTEAAAYGGASAPPPAVAAAPPPPTTAAAPPPPVVAAAPPVVAPSAPVAAPAPAPVASTMRAEDTLRYDQPIPFGPYPVNGHSIAEIVTTFTPLFPPIEDLPEELWKDKHCTTCHKWDKATLCQQGATYVKAPKYALRIQHPFGGTLKVALMRWVKSGCQ
jgi:hypothetical protein